MTKVEKLKSEVLSFEPPCPKCDLGYSGVVCNCTNPAMVDAVDGLIQAARDEVLDSPRPCCSAKCRNWEEIKDPKCVFCAGTGRDIARFDCVCVPCRGTGKVVE